MQAKALEMKKDASKAVIRGEGSLDAPDDQLEIDYDDDYIYGLDKYWV